VRNFSEDFIDAFSLQNFASLRLERSGREIGIFGRITEFISTIAALPLFT
jgi:hypothetical protein